MNRLIIFPIVVVLLLLSIFAYGADVAEYTKAIDQSPADMKYKFYLLRGMAYRNQGNIDAAIKDFGTSIQMHPDSCSNGHQDTGQFQGRLVCHRVSELR